MRKSQFAVDGGLRAAAALGSRHAHTQLRCRLGSLGLGPGEGLDCSPLRVPAAAAAWACWNPFSARAAGMLAPRRGLPSPAGAPGAGSRFVGTSMYPQAMSSRSDLVELSSLLRARARQSIRPRPCASCTSEPFGGARAPQEGGRASAALGIVSGCTLDGSGRPRRGDLCLLSPLKAISATESRAGAGAARGWSRENSPSG